MEDLSDASFLGKLLVLPANARLDWKAIARYKHSSLFGLVFCSEGKKFYNIDTCMSIVQNIFLRNSPYRCSARVGSGLLKNIRLGWKYGDEEKSLLPLTPRGQMV